MRIRGLTLGLALLSGLTACDSHRGAAMTVGWTFAGGNCTGAARRSRCASPSAANRCSRTPSTAGSGLGGLHRLLPRHVRRHDAGARCRPGALHLDPAPGSPALDGDVERHRRSPGDLPRTTPCTTSAGPWSAATGDPDEIPRCGAGQRMDQVAIFIDGRTRAATAAHGLNGKPGHHALRRRPDAHGAARRYNSQESVTVVRAERRASRSLRDDSRAGARRFRCTGTWAGSRCAWAAVREPERLQLGHPPDVLPGRHRGPGAGVPVGARAPRPSRSSRPATRAWSWTTSTRASSTPVHRCLRSGGDARALRNDGGRPGHLPRGPEPREPADRHRPAGCARPGRTARLALPGLHPALPHLGRGTLRGRPRPHAAHGIRGPSASSTRGWGTSPSSARSGRAFPRAHGVPR